VRVIAVPIKTDYQRMFVTHGKARHWRRKVIFGVLGVGLALTFVLVPLFPVEKPATVPSLNAYDASTSGSFSYLVFHCGEVLESGTVATGPASFIFGPPTTTIDQSAWIC